MQTIYDILQLIVAMIQIRFSINSSKTERKNKMKNNNLPDNCQGNGTHLPWNEPEQEVYGCWRCGEEVEESSLTDIKTKSNGWQSISDCCIKEYVK